MKRRSKDFSTADPEDRRPQRTVAVLLCGLFSGLNYFSPLNKTTDCNPLQLYCFFIHSLHQSTICWFMMDVNRFKVQSDVLMCKSAQLKEGALWFFSTTAAQLCFHQSDCCRERLHRPVSVMECEVHTAIRHTRERNLPAKYDDKHSTATQHSSRFCSRSCNRLYIRHFLHIIDRGRKSFSLCNMFMSARCFKWPS